MGDIAKLQQQVTIGTLPDDVLLKIFKRFVDEMYGRYDETSEEWRTLVHICQRWRNLAFTYPYHLNLQLFCKPPWRSVKKMLDIWSELPIFIYAWDHPDQKAKYEVAAALKLNHRVSRIYFLKTSDSAWDTFVPLMQQPFPALTHLCVLPYGTIKDPISRSFLGGSAPFLRDLILNGVPFPALPELLLSTTNLVRLSYQNIPPSGYISPRAMVTTLSRLTRLESLSLTFLPPRSFPDVAIHIPPRSLPDMAIHIPPPHTRILLPALTLLRYRGVPEYMEDFVAQIDAPSLESMEITLLHREVLVVSQLAVFFRHADKLSLIDRAKVTFEGDRISVNLSQELDEVKTLTLNLTCYERELRFSYLAQFCALCLPTLSPFERLDIRVPYSPWTVTWEDVIDDPDPQWLELLRPFNTVKDLCLHKYTAPRVAQTLRGLPAERVMEVLPALENVFISDLEAFGPVRDVISEFADARQLSGRPVSIYYR